MKNINLELCEKTVRRIWNKESTDWTLKDDAICIDKVQLPLMPWRFDRRLNEMRGLVGKDKGVYSLCAYKSVRIDHAEADFSTILMREIDVCQWLLGKDLVSVYAIANNEKAILALAETASGIVCAFDLATTLCEETNPITRHEIIGVEGIITDRSINEQVPVDALYVFSDNQKNPESFTDMDISMLGLNPTEIQLVDYIIDLLANPDQYDELLKRYEHLTKLVECFNTSIKTGEKIFVKEK